MLTIGVLGTGHLGKIHIKCIQQAHEHYELAGFYDPDPATAAEVAQAFGIRAFSTVEALLEAVEVVDIVSPTITHFELASKAISAGKHVFIEKPLTHTLAQAKELLALTHKMNIKVQVGHVERFNPALLALDDLPISPMFIEAHRLAIFNPRGTDVSVILDLMIHDLDIILSLTNSPVSKVSANGVAVVSDTPDIANARIEFANGCVANLTASRISLKQMRKLRLFQKDAYISVDLLDKQAQVVRLYEPADPQIPQHGQLIPLQTASGEKRIHLDMPAIEPTNAIRLELETFAESIRANTRPKVSIEDGYRALELAERIAEVIAGNPAISPTNENQ
jgi:predicted dehydrogenase